MRYLVGILLLASPVAAYEPVYSWRSRADDPDRVYLYRDGKQVGGWCYADSHYRPFDGKVWGTPVAAAPVRPPVRAAVVVTPPVVVAPPAVVAPPVVVTPAPPLPRLRGPLRVRAATVMSDAIADTTVRMMAEIPRAVAESVRQGNYQLKYQFSVTRPGQQPAAPPGPVQPAPRP